MRHPPPAEARHEHSERSAAFLSKAISRRNTCAFQALAQAGYGQFDIVVQPDRLKQPMRPALEHGDARLWLRKYGAPVQDVVLQYAARAIIDHRAGLQPDRTVGQQPAVQAAERIVTSN